MGYKPRYPCTVLLSGCFKAVYSHCLACGSCPHLQRLQKRLVNPPMCSQYSPHLSLPHIRVSGISWGPHRSFGGRLPPLSPNDLQPYFYLRPPWSWQSQLPQVRTCPGGSLTRAGSGVHLTHLQLKSLQIQVQWLHRCTTILPG